ARGPAHTAAGGAIGGPRCSAARRGRCADSAHRTTDSGETGPIGSLWRVDAACEGLLCTRDQGICMTTATAPPDVDPASLAVRTRGLRKTYRTRHGRQVAVQGLDLDVPLGGVHGFLGPNGSG